MRVFPGAIAYATKTGIDAIHSLTFINARLGCDDNPQGKPS